MSSCCSSYNLLQSDRIFSSIMELTSFNALIKLTPNSVSPVTKAPDVEVSCIQENSNDVIEDDAIAPCVVEKNASIKNSIDINSSLSENENTVIFVDVANKTNEKTQGYVTEDEIKTSLAEKEENLDSLSLTGSGTDGSLSHLSTLTKNSTFDDLSLNALRNRQNELINSIKNKLDTSGWSVASDDLIGESFNVSTSTAVDDCVTFQETVPPAAKFKPSFSISETSQTVRNTQDAHNQTQYEEAFASLHEVLSSTTTDTILDRYSSKLDAYKEEDNKKFEEIFSQIDHDKRSFFSLKDDPIIELDDQTNLTSGDDLAIVSTSIIDDSPGIIGETTIVPPQLAVESIPIRENVNETPTISDSMEDKDPDILIIGEDEGAEDDFDEDLLLASDDEQDTVDMPKSTIKEPAKSSEFFISEDPEENRDNNDPKWDNLRNLGSDYERYMAVRARWKNFEIPNPKRDLTCRCRNVNHFNVYSKGLSCKNEFGKRQRSSPDTDRRFSKRPRRESCTVLFELSIQQLIHAVDNERFQIEREQEERVNLLADRQSMDQIIAQRKRKNEAFMRQMKQRHFMETEALIKDFRRRRDELTESARLKMEALRKAGDEVRQFHEFYPSEKAANGTHDVNGLIYLTETEVQEILEVEKMLIRFESFYTSSTRA